MVRLKMYIVNGSAQSQEKVETFRRMLEEALGRDYHLEILDIMENLEAALKDNVLATPTVIKSHPAPIRKIIGDLRDCEKILKELGLGRGSPDFQNA